MTPARAVRSIPRQLPLIGICVCLLSTTTGSSTHAQGRPLSDAWRWTAYSTDDGLPDQQITALAVAGDGRVWAGTRAGISWFDGYVWHGLGNEDGIPAQPVAYLSQDGGDGVLAIVHDRLFRGDTTGFHHLSTDVDARALWPDRESNTIELLTVGAAPAGTGQILVLVREGEEAPVLLSLHEGTLERTQPPAPLDVGSMLWTSRRGDPFLGTTRGLYRWRAGEWTRVVGLRGGGNGFSTVAENEQELGLASLADPSHSQALITWSGDRWTPVATEGANPVQSLDIAPTGEAIVVYQTGHVRIRMDGRWGEVVLPSDVRESVTVVRYTREGDIWIGTGSGLFLYRATSSRWATWAFPFPDLRNRVHAILLRQDGSTWTGTGDGLVVYRPEREVPESIREILGVPLGLVTGLAEDGSGNVWVTSGVDFHGAFRWNGRRWRRFTAEDGLAAPRIHQVAVDREGRPWLLGLAQVGDSLDGPGAFVLNGDRFERWGEEEGLLSGTVYDFAEQPDGTRWFATLSGISRWRDGVWTHWDRWHTTLANGGLLDTPIGPRSIAAGRGRVWIGDRRFGLATIDASDELHFVATAGEPPGQVGVEDVQVEPDGTVWVTSTQGLCISRQGDWACFDQGIGLANASLWPLVVTPQQVYVGTLGRGLQVLNRAEERAPGPRVRLVDPLVERRTALIRWTAHTLYGAIPADRIHTRYRIDDDPWSPWSTLREVTLRGLRPGRHTVQLQARGLFGSTGGATATTEFRVQPAVLLRPVVVPLGASLVLLIGIGLQVWRQRRNHLQQLRDSDVTRALRITQFAVDQAADCVLWLDADARVRYVNKAASSTYGYSRDEFETLSGFDISDELTPETWPGIWAELRGKGKLRRHSFHRDRDQRRFPAEIVASHIATEGQEYAVVFARDMSERIAAERALRDSEEKYAKAFRSSPNAIFIARAEDGCILEVNDQALRLLGRRREVALGSTPVELGMFSDESKQVHLIARILGEGGVSGVRLRIRTATGDERLVLLFAEPIDLGGESCIISVAQDITAQERTRSALEQSRQELRVLSSRLMEAQEAERGRISRELHDEIGQALAAVKLNLQAINRLSADEKITKQVVDGMGVVDRAVEDVRNLSRDLRPSVLDDLGLPAALRWFIQRLSERAEIEVRLDITESGRRPAMAVETACYRIAQEAVTNVLRHASATRVDVTLTALVDGLILRVRDDGRGFVPPGEDEPQPADAHLGLIGMRERAAGAGGKLAIRSEPGSGTEVEAWFPLDPFSADRTAHIFDSHQVTSS
jgi:PAS domain S-box-containing protein